MYNINNFPKKYHKYYILYKYSLAHDKKNHSVYILVLCVHDVCVVFVYVYTIYVYV